MVANFADFSLLLPITVSDTINFDGSDGTGQNVPTCDAIFVGTAAATRRNDHLYLTAISESMHGTMRIIAEVIIRLVVLGVAFCLIWYGYLNYLRGFGSFRLPSGTPIASLYVIIPVSGVLIALFTIEQLVNGLRNGFDHSEPPEDDGTVPMVEGSREGVRP